MVLESWSNADIYKEYKKPYKSVLLILSNGVSDFRMSLLGKHLIRYGYGVEMVNEVPSWIGIHHDVIICSRPIGPICSFLLDQMKSGIPVVVDLDDDFFSIPKENPSYVHIGPGNKEYQDLLRETVLAVTRLVVTTAELGTRYGRDSIVIGNYMDEDNALWGMIKGEHLFSIGWAGTTTHRQDFDLVQGALLRILTERQDVRLVIGVDQQIYNRFKDVPEQQKLFIPALQFDIYPCIYSFMDMVVVPLLDTEFNRAKSDIKLLDAGAAGIPFVASPLPMYLEWGWGQGCGGLYAETEGEWYHRINEYIENPTMVSEHGNAGKEKSKTRTSEVMSKKWLALLEGL